MTRKLVSVRRVSEILPIEGADNIVVAKVEGWQVVTQKDWCKPNDLVAFFEIDSFIPVRPEYEFLRKSGYRNTKNLGEGFRLKTIKLRKQLSQGLIMPLTEVLSFHCVQCVGDKEWPTPDRKDYVCCSCPRFNTEEGFDLTEILGVQLYEKPIPTQLSGKVRGNFPPYIRKTDQERAQNILKELTQFWHSEDYFEVTKKLDGSSMTVYNKGDYQGVCSRNWDLDSNIDELGNPRFQNLRNAFWECAQKHSLIDIVQKMKTETGKDFALQGELMGPGVQDNRENLSELTFFLFDIWHIDGQCYSTPEERNILALHFDIREVPFFSRVRLKDIVEKPENMIQDLLEYADVASLNHPVCEGLVFRRWAGDFSFKVINNRFLLAEKE